MALLPDLCDQPGDKEEEEEEEDGYVFHNPLSIQPLILPTTLASSNDIGKEPTSSSESSTALTAVVLATTVVPDVVDFQRWEREWTEQGEYRQREKEKKEIE